MGTGNEHGRWLLEQLTPKWFQSQCGMSVSPMGWIGFEK